MFIKDAVPVAVIPQHTGLEEVLRAGEGAVTSNNYNKQSEFEESTVFVLNSSNSR